MNTITLSVMKLSEIQALSKLLKTEFIYINEFGQVFGFDDGIYTMVFLNQTISLPVPMVLDCLSLRNLLKTKILTDSVTIEWGTEFCYINENSELESLLYKKIELDNKINNIIRVTNENPILVNFDNLQLDETWQKYISASADSGAKFWVNPNKTYVDSIFKGYLSINKGDKVSLIVRDYDIQRRALLNEYIIQKKKGILIKVYSVSLNLAK